jgi:predicted kinase
MKKIILLVGIPGSGKTTLCEKLKSKGFQSISLDSIRAEIYGDAIQQGNPEDVATIFRERLAALLATSVQVVVDNTNLKFEHRKQIIDLAKKANYEDIQLWILDVPLEVCLERNKNRERQVDEDVIANQFMILNRTGRPKASEGRIVIIRPGKDENDLRFFFPGQNI